jgi:hypothetical protein
MTRSKAALPGRILQGWRDHAPAAEARLCCKVSTKNH